MIKNAIIWYFCIKNMATYVPPVSPPRRSHLLLASDAAGKGSREAVRVRGGEARKEGCLMIESCYRAAGRTPAADMARRERLSNETSSQMRGMRPQPHIRNSDVIV